MSTLNYARGLPIGNNEVPFYNSPPAIKAVTQTFSENAVVSSVITLSPNTTAIEITTVGAPVAMRWVSQADGTTAATSVITTAGSGGTSNFDHVQTSASRVRFIVPIEVQNNAQGYSSQVGANIANGLFQRIAYKSQGIASVYVTEYGSSNSY